LHQCRTRNTSARPENQRRRRVRALIGANNLQKACRSARFKGTSPGHRLFRGKPGLGLNLDHGGELGKDVERRVADGAMPNAIMSAASATTDTKTKRRGNDGEHAELSLTCAKSSEKLRRPVSHHAVRVWPLASTHPPLTETCTRGAKVCGAVFS